MTSWRRTTAEVVARLRVAAEGEPGMLVNSGTLDGLPGPVRRYLTWALPTGTTLPRTVTLQQEGAFRLGKRWSRFTATEYFAAWPPAFVWDARIRMVPLVAVLVRDSYLAAEGRMHAKLAGMLTLVDQYGTPAMATASLLRWLAETAWLPSALLPRDGLSWREVDESSARIEVQEGSVRAVLGVRFGDDGGIAEVNGERQRDVHGVPMLTPWRGRFADYTRLHGLMIPQYGEVAWLIDGREEPYWRGRIVAADYDRGAWRRT